VAFAIFCASWMPVLLLGAPPRLFSAVGAILGLALNAVLPTYLSVPISGESALRDLSVMAIVIPLAICFRILITFAYNRTRFSVIIAATTHASFNKVQNETTSETKGSRNAACSLD
jgi:hypothetical protein